MKEIDEQTLLFVPKLRQQEDLLKSLGIELKTFEPFPFAYDRPREGYYKTGNSILFNGRGTTLDAETIIENKNQRILFERQQLEKYQLGKKKLQNELEELKKIYGFLLGKRKKLLE